MNDEIDDILEEIYEQGILMGANKPMFNSETVKSENKAAIQVLINKARIEELERLTLYSFKPSQEGIKTRIAELKNGLNHA